SRRLRSQIRESPDSPGRFTKIDNICYEMGQCELSIRRAE
ncbi:hypothetical protein, partial [Mycobacterium tuberculosis]